jgi:ATP-dependent DNA helicase RecG
MIPLKLETILKDRVVERDRIEYKRGWNPSETIHTICAFANDFPNVNGGYIVIGIESVDGIPLLPPYGIQKERIDAIQQEIFQYCNMIQPRYLPKIEIIDYQESGVFVIYLRCSAGDAGPYQAPEEVYSDKKSKKQLDKTMRYWIRPASVTARAAQNEISELFDKFNAVPYDDRVNYKATIGDISCAYLEDFLRESDSSLVDELKNSTIEELLVALEVANETDTDLRIRNIGVLMFGERPDKLIPGAQIDLVRFHSPEAEGSDDFTAKTFMGPLFKQVRDAMNYLKTTVFDKKTVKISGQMESETYHNYPYDALEELLVNAIFHKSYREPEPVEIRVYVDCIMVLNYPGPAKWINMERFTEGKVKARKYRNRRIGEFLREIDLSEKQSTGITKVLRELRKNGSPPPEFETDDERHYMIATVRAREGFETYTEKSAQKNERTLSELLSELLDSKVYEKLASIIDYLELNDSIRPADAEAIIGKSASTARRYIGILVEAKVLEQQGKANNTVYVKTDSWKTY